MPQHSDNAGSIVSKVSVVLFSRFTVGCMSKLFGFKHAEIGIFSHDLNLSHPWALPIPFNKVYTFIAGLTVLAYWPIRLILGVSRFSKVGKSIIRFLPVNMVNLLRWKRSCHVQPCEAVRLVSFSGYAYQAITFLVCGASNIANFCATSDRDKPSKNPGLRAIVENRFKVFLRQLHDAPRMRIGVRGLEVGSFQRPAILTHQTLNDSYGGSLAAA